MHWRDLECQTINPCICNSLYSHLFLINHYCLFVCLKNVRSTKYAHCQPPKLIYIYIDICWLKHMIFKNSNDNIKVRNLKAPKPKWNNPISHRFISLLFHLGKRWVIITLMICELQMRATGSIFIVDIDIFEYCFQHHNGYE